MISYPNVETVGREHVRRAIVAENVRSSFPHLATTGVRRIGSREWDEFAREMLVSSTNLGFRSCRFVADADGG